MKLSVFLSNFDCLDFIVGALTQQKKPVILIAATLASIASFEDAMRRYARVESPKARTRQRIDVLK